jgi:hypothetical protein
VTDLPAILITQLEMQNAVAQVAPVIGAVVAEEQLIGMGPKMEKHMDQEEAADSGIKILVPALLGNQE